MFHNYQINLHCFYLSFVVFFVSLYRIKTYYMKLSLFDFDNTLVETPYEDSPYLDTEESLDSDKWKFKFNEKTINNYKSESTDSSVVTVLLTNRIDSVQHCVKEILSSKKITFDEEMFIKGKDGNRSKGKRVEKLLKKYE